MRIGLMSDIHGNRQALEAVVADAAERGVDRWWVLGDLVAIGPDPVRAVELIANLPHAQVISGNTERYVLTDDRPPPHPEGGCPSVRPVTVVEFVRAGVIGWKQAGPSLSAGVTASPHGCDSRRRSTRR